MKTAIFKSSILSLGLASVCMMMSGCDTEKIYTTDYTLVHPIDKITFLCGEGDEYPMTPGMTYQLDWTVGPDEVDDETVVFSSTDESVATVSQEGVITAVGLGDAIIKANTPLGFGAEARLMVHVKENVVLAQKIDVEIAGTPAEFYYESDVMNLNATILPADHDYNYLTWTSSDEAVATVDANGKVNLIKEGDATITVSSTDGSGVKGTWPIHVYKMVDVESLEIAPLAGEVCLDRGAFDLDVTYYPLGATAGSVEWASSNEFVATVERGRVKPTGFGTTIITGTTRSGQMATVEVTVTSGLRIWDVQNTWRQWAPGAAGAQATYTDKTMRIPLAAQNNGSWRGDIKLPASNDNPVWFDFSNYPIFAFKANIPADGRNTLDGISTDGVNAGNTQSNEGRYNSNTPIELSDGTHIYYYDISSKYPNGLTGFRLFQIKVADIPAENVAPTKDYEVYWLRTFKSKEEMISFAEAEIANAQ